MLSPVVNAVVYLNTLDKNMSIKKENHTTMLVYAKNKIL